MTFPREPDIQVERTMSLHEGINTRLVPWNLSENSAVSIENLIINEFGQRVRRNGAKAFGGRSDAPGGMAAYSDKDFTEFLAAIWGGALYKSTGNGGWDQIASGASLATGRLHDFVQSRVNANVGLSFATCVQTTDRSQLTTYDVTADAMTAASLYPRCLTFFQNRLWAGDEQTLWWSNINNPAGFSTGNTLLIEPGLAGHITAIVPARDTTPKLWIFKHESLLLLEPHWGSSSALIPAAGDALDLIQTSLRVLSKGAGCVATRSAVWVPGVEGSDMFFLGNDGVRSLRRAESDEQSGAGFPISWNAKAAVDRINFAHADKAAAAVFDNGYHLAVPLDGATENTHILRYDILSQAWSLHWWQGQDLRTAQLADKQKLFFLNNFRAGDTSVTSADTSPTAAPYQVYQAYTGQLDAGGSNIIFEETSRGYVLGEPLRKKRWDAVTFLMNAGATSSYEIQYNRDLNGWNTLTTDIIGGRTPSIIMGVSPLPWQLGNGNFIRRSYDLSALDPAYMLQIRLSGFSGATDVGAITVYSQEVKGYLADDVFERET
jgi:hypothetical protein